MRAFAHTFGILAPTADSASGGFFRQIPPLPVTPAVGRPRIKIISTLHEHPTEIMVMKTMQIQRKKSIRQHQQVPSLSRKDCLSRFIRVGDWVRLVEIPPSIADMPHETQLVFKKAFGKTFRIESFNEYDLAELNLSKKVARNNYIWVEPEYLLLFRRKQVK